MTALWNGRVVYQRHWHTFFDDLNREWLRMGGLSLAVFLADTMLFASGRMTTPFIISGSLAGSAIFSAVFLHQTHSGGRLATAPDISSYIVKVEDFNHGLRPLSLTFTLPHALASYSAIFLAMGLLMLSLENAATFTELLVLTSAWCFPFSAAFFLASVF